MNRQFRRALITLALVTIAFGIWATLVKAQTCDRDCTADGKRAVRAGKIFTGYVHSNGGAIIRFTNKSLGSGWVLLGSPTCNFNNFGTAIVCVGYSGPVALKIQAPVNGGVEGKLDNGKLYLTVDYMTEGEVQYAYYKYDTGFCNPSLFSVAKGSPGHVVEAKYVCTNHPDFEGE